jgi:hypothetical protein
MEARGTTRGDLTHCALALAGIEALRDRDERRTLAVRAFGLVQMAEAAGASSDAECDSPA